MRKLIIMVGLPASGKSTIARLVAERCTPYGYDAQDCVPTLSLDAFRRLMCPTHAGTDGERTCVSGKNRKAYVAAYYKAVEAHMQAGSTLILDNTHVVWRNVREAYQLAARYRYEVLFVCVDTPLTECVERDGNRRHTERVGKDAIAHMATQLETLDLARVTESVRPRPKTRILHVNPMPDEHHVVYAETLAKRVVDTFLTEPCDTTSDVASHYVIVGDVHAAADRLQTLADELDAVPDAHVIFCGDYVDRARRPGDTCRTLDVLAHIMDTHIVTLVEGNHDEHMARILTGDTEAYVMYRQSAISYDEMRSADESRDTRYCDRYRRMAADFVPLATFSVRGDRYVVTHGGIATEHAEMAARYETMPAWLAASDCIYGCADRERVYLSAHPSDYSAHSITAADGGTFDGYRVIQVHGHRNATGEVKLSETHFDLEHKVETEDGDLATLWVDARTGRRDVRLYS